MAVCTYIRGKKRKICTGDLDRQIEIYTRSIQTPLDSNFMEHSELYTLKAKPWAMIMTRDGITTFDGIEIAGVQAYEIYIRYNASITTEDFVQINGRNIQIASVEDLDLRHEFMRLMCIDKGSVNKEAAL